MFGIRDRRMRRRNSPIRKQLGFESLERRELLSGTPPIVTDVMVSSTDWSTTFFDYLEANSLGAGGYSIPTGSSAQTQALSWNNINQIKIVFSEDVNVDKADLALTGINHAQYLADSFHYDAQTHVATWTLADYLTRDRFLIDLDADGLNPVVDLEGYALDGEWVNNVSCQSAH